MTPNWTEHKQFCTSNLIYINVYLPIHALTWMAVIMTATEVMTSVNNHNPEAYEMRLRI